MRIAFMGTPQFAADILQGLMAQHDVACVYTMPDKVRGRGKRLVPSPVKEVAQELGLDVRTPSSLSDAEELGHIQSLELDAICVAAYGKLLPPSVLSAPRFGCINVHASLLPRWRGAAPIERAVLAGDEQVGVCIMRMEEGLDTGPYCIRRSIQAAGKSAASLTDELSLLGLSALLSALAQIEEGCVNWIEQGADGVAYADKILKGELNLDPADSAEASIRRVLASSEVHPCRAVIAGKEATIVSAAIADSSEVPLEGGMVLGDDRLGGDDVVPCASAGDVRATKKRLFLRVRDGWIEVVSLKPAGRKAMPASAFLAGAHLGIDSKWGKVGGE